MKKNRIPRKCKICNKEFTIKLSEFKNGFGKTCSYKCAGLYRAKHFIKDKNPNWKGGNWTDISKEIKIRDDYTCQVCGLKEQEIVEVDHIKPKKTNPELKLERSNLITLCPNCHKRKTVKELRLPKKKHNYPLNL